MPDAPPQGPDPQTVALLRQITELQQALKRASATIKALQMRSNAFTDEVARQLDASEEQAAADARRRAENTEGK